MDNPRSLTQDEARERAELIDVDRYDIAVDMTDLLDGDEFRAVSTVRFRCRRPGASTFVDCVAEVNEATLNGKPIGADKVENSRIVLDDLAEDNVLLVDSVQRSTGQGTGVHRSVDPSDKEAYVWTTFEPDDARRAWACFDQPDLKAPHGFSVTAPARWTVLSNSAPGEVVDEGDAKRWTFPDTPRLSTYVPVVNAGPFYELRSERDGFDLGLYCRQSLKQFLDRDAEELFDVTAAGLVFFGDKFGLPFPQRKYDQVWVPDMGGAMENFGCITWGDQLIFRANPSHQERELRVLVLLHEMAHMWFGDMVTMKWWEDLWLNEAFAEWACHWAASEATAYTDVWSSFLSGWKLGGYTADMAPTTHPIRQPVGDVAEAAASFDGITYPKGASVLKQLFAYVGEEAFVSGLRSYFSKHAWGNTSLDDLMDELAAASGRDLAEWTRLWLDTAGTDRLVLESGDNGELELHTTAPPGADPRPHRLEIGVYDRSGEELVRRELVPVEAAGAVTPLADVPGDADLLLVNDEDLTFASVRPDDASLQTMLADAGRLPNAVSRAVAVTTAWDMLMTGEVTTREFVGCVTRALATETVDAVIEPFLGLASRAAARWSPDDQRDELMGLVADTCVGLAGQPARRQVALRTLAENAVTAEHFAVLDDAGDKDHDIRWRLATRLAELGRADDDEVAELENTDPDPDAWIRAFAVHAARPDPAAKEQAWTAIMDERKIPYGSLFQVVGAFWRPSQADILSSYPDRYLRALPDLQNSGMLPAMALSAAMFPTVGSDESFVDEAMAAARGEGVVPVVRNNVIERADQLQRMLRARQLKR